MDPIYGFRDTTTLLPEERPGQFREKILKIRPNGTSPFLALTAALKTEATDDPEFKWFASKVEDRRLQLAASISASDTVWTVVGGAAAYPPRTIFRVENTNERVEVVAAPNNDTQITVSRGFAGTTPAAVTITTAGVNPFLHCIGTAFEQGSLPPSPVAAQTASFYNYTQIQRHTFGTTRTLDTMSKLRTGTTRMRGRTECLEKHSEGLDDQFLFGTRGTTTTNGNLRYLSGGMEWFVRTYAPNNVRDFSNINSGALDMETLEEESYELFRWNAGELMCICGLGVLKTINQVARKNGTWNIYTDEKMMGVSVTTLVNPYGRIVFKTHPRWSLFRGGVVGGTNYYSLENYAIIFPPSHIMVRKKDFDMKFEEKLQTDGQDGFKSGFISDLGLELHHPEAFFIWENVSNPTKDS